MILMPTSWKDTLLFVVGNTQYIQLTFAGIATRQEDVASEDMQSNKLSHISILFLTARATAARASISPLTMTTDKMITVSKQFLFRHMTIGAATIITNNIAKDLDLQALEAAVYRLVDRNPILSGTLCYGPKDNPGVFVTPGKFDKFVYRIEVPRGTTIPSPVKLVEAGKTAELQELVQTHLEPLIPPSQPGNDELAQQKQLFSIYVLELEEGYFYYAYRFSHAIGDGVTYYKVMEELNSIYKLQLTGGHQEDESAILPPAIQWESRSAITFDFTHQALSIPFWISIISMAIVSAIFGMPKTQKIFLSQDKINAKKKELLAHNDGTANAGVDLPYLSTNDVVTAAICEATVDHNTQKPAYDCMVLSVDYRSRWPNCHPNDGGSLTSLFPVSCTPKQGQDPKGIRRAVQSIQGNPNQDIPFWPFFLGRGYNETNWACIQKTLAGTVFHAPSKSIVDVNPMPIAIIYQPNPKEIGIMCKLAHIADEKNGKKQGLLAGILID
ncbi:expressed unknown protein [Seminavis robusta]|uniref:Uncharacterized protein n=1 Tax=Seminavis robusta TaxID=568900 RepID=A0A9N8F290_9STRA|nr:expressed unknown protein [Seminavis robusta]|eukprot:Sro3424_g347850.1 n/a (499) ;mRNA; r:1189-2820